jgi:GABA permease
VGSFTEYIRLALGDWAGFVSGWLYWYSWVIVVAIEALAGARLLQEWLALPVWQLVLLLMLTLTGVNLLSARSYGEFEFWLSSIKVVAIVLFILIAGAFALGLTSPGGPTFANMVAHGGFAPFGWVSVLAGMTTVIFSMCGAEMATIAAAESSEPARVVSRMTTSIIVRILLFYVVSVLLIVAVTPWIEVRSGSSPFALALEHVGVPGGATIMNLVVLTAVLSCLNSGLYVTSRILFTLAAKGDAPRGLVALSQRRVPARAILLGSSLGYAAVIASIIAPEGLFGFLVNASGAVMIFVYLFTCFAHLKLRKQFEKQDPSRLTVKVWLFPWVSWLTVGAMVGVLGAMATRPDLASQFYASFAALGVVLACYWLVRARRRAAVGLPSAG